MKPLSRRSVTAGLGAAIAAVVPIGLSLAGPNSQARVQHCICELEQAMREAFPGATTDLITNKIGSERVEGMNPFVMVVAQGGLKSS
jgi:hypothetical protein